MDEKNVSSTETKKSLTTPYILKGEFFEILKQEGEAVTVQCKKCPQKNVYKGSVKSTGNFHMHIKRKHPESLERLQELKLQSFMDRKIKITEKFKNNTLFTLIQNKMNNIGNNVTSNSLSSNTNSTTQPMKNFGIFNTNNNNSNQPMNCCKKAKINEKYDLNSCNIQQTLLDKNDEILLKPNCFSTPNDSKNLNNKLTSTFNQSRNFEQGKCLNNYYSLTQKGNNFQVTSATPLSQDQGFIFQGNPVSNNNLPIAATLTAASMILSPTQDVLGKIDNHLKAIEKQLHLRNQIETNKIYLDLAKFKYLHPNFAFQG